VILSWWWLLPLAPAALGAAASPLIIRRLQAETAEVEAVTRSVALATRRARTTWAGRGAGDDRR
jgi:hypothetical protein